MQEFLFLQFLLYMHLNTQGYDFKTDHCFVMRNDSALPFCNRVCSTPEATVQEIQQIKSYFATTPFRWFVRERDWELTEKLKQEGFTHKITYPAMKININALKKDDCAQHIEVTKINHHDHEQFKTWMSIVCKSYAITVPEEFEKFISYLITRCKDTIHFYTASYKGVPAAVSLIIMHDDVVGLHWVGTLPEYRGKGLGYVVSHKPLVDAHNLGCKQAILLASDMGFPVYKRIGFKTYATYDVYG